MLDITFLGVYYLGMKHLDLFSGIGGFAYAVDQVWENAEHIFCDNDKFCQQVLKKHWPNSKIYDDIRVITDTRSEEQRGLSGGKRKEISTLGEIHLITGGFPCQPFSQAGKRKGTDDDRHLWPEMLRVIRLAKPEWVIAENVRGILTIEGGLVFEQVCLDLEGEGYEVQPFVIPAVAINAPHRRDRVWFVAHNNKRKSRPGNEPESRETTQQKSSTNDADASDTKGEFGNAPRLSRGKGEKNTRLRKPNENENGFTSWERNWLEVATELCGMDDGLSPKLDFAGWSKARHRVERLKSLGNSIVPQVAVEIMKAIKYS